MLYYIIFILPLSSTLGQSIETSNLLDQKRIASYDAGIDWNHLSNFGMENLFIDYTDGKDNIFKYQIGFIGGENYSMFNGYVYFQKKNYFAFFNPGFSKDIANGNPRGIFSDHYRPPNDFSGIGYKNDWALLQICRGKEHWGAGNGIQLALSKNSNSYDYFLLSSNYGNLRVKYIHGYLGQADDSINRFITGRGIEYINNNSLLIGFSEIVIYSGKNRQFDFAYINPISSHVELELNDRLNINGTNNANAVWQIHTDLFFYDKFRLSANYLIDEFVFDKDVDDDKKHRDAFSVRIAYTPTKLIKKLSTIYIQFVTVDSRTFRHFNGYNNFTHNHRPLGWREGSDGEETTFGFNYLYNSRFVFNISYSKLKSGEQSIIHREYEQVFLSSSQNFPSGKINYLNTLNGEFILKLRNNLSMMIGLEINQDSLYELNLGFNIHN